MHFFRKNPLISDIKPSRVRGAIWGFQFPKRKSTVITVVKMIKT